MLDYIKIRNTRIKGFREVEDFDFVDVGGSVVPVYVETCSLSKD